MLCFVSQYYLFTLTAVEMCEIFPDDKFGHFELVLFQSLSDKRDHNQSSLLAGYDTLFTLWTPLYSRNSAVIVLHYTIEIVLWFYVKCIMLQIS